MDTPHLITELNAEIEWLRQVRALLAGGGMEQGLDGADVLQHRLHMVPTVCANGGY